MTLGLPVTPFVPTALVGSKKSGLPWESFRVIPSWEASQELPETPPYAALAGSENEHHDDHRG